LGSFAKRQWEIPPTRAEKSAGSDVFGGFSGLARLLNCTSHRPQLEIGTGEKGDFQMSGQSKLNRTLVAAAAALLMSTVTVGAAVGPAQAVAAPAQGTLNA
jgi:hypothetical protein